MPFELLSERMTKVVVAIFAQALYDLDRLFQGFVVLSGLVQVIGDYVRGHLLYLFHCDTVSEATPNFTLLRDFSVVNHILYRYHEPVFGDLKDGELW